MNRIIRQIRSAPSGIGILLIAGPSLVWCSEYIGSGEVILATRTGAILGTGVTWAVISGIFLKYWIGMSGARYTVVTGEGLIDLFSRMPGPRNWAVWLVFVAQLTTAAIAIGSIASAAGVFLASLLPISSFAGGWIVTVFALLIAWTGRFGWLKYIMSGLVFVVLAGVFYVAVKVFPGIEAFISGLVPRDPTVPLWALEKGIDPNPWREVLPLIGWGAGGFASQVWYSYWVMGAGYGRARKDRYGEPANTDELKALTTGDARRLKGWFRVVYTDASLAMVIGILATLGFLYAGAGVLGKLQVAPDGPEVAVQLSEIFGQNWGKWGGLLFMVGGTAALVATQIGQLAGWPRLLADAARICIPGVKERFTWKIQFRFFLLLFFLSNMILVYTLGYKPVSLVKLGALFDGLLLTPLQAVWICWGLFVTLPRMLSKEARKILQPNPVFAAGLILAFLVFGYFCVFQLPFVFR